MDWGTLKTLARGSVPYAKSNVVTDAIVEEILYNGMKDVATELQFMHKNTTFNLVAEQREYFISDIATDFFMMDRPGVHFYDSTQYEPLDPVTRKWLDEHYYHWFSRNSADPLYYYQEQNIIGFHPKPVTSQADGGKLHYIALPTKPTSDADYPFEGSVEISRSLLLHDAVLDYFRWRILPYIGKDDEYNRARNQYKEERARKKKLYKARPDISASRFTKYSHFSGTRRF